MNHVKRAGPLLLLLASCAPPAPAALPDRPPASSLENLHPVAPGVWAGAEPRGEPAFEELARLGVKTVISVDGVQPSVEAARRHGLRYVHLPLGYDGIPPERALELAKALLDLAGPVYVHCHHGKHRGPAAAAVACVVAGRIGNAEALEVLKEMGTGQQYVGLWASAREAKPADPGALRALRVDFRETSPVPPLAGQMVSLDEAFGRLELCEKAGWRIPADHPDLDPPHEALQAREILAEILRTDEVRARPLDFQKRMGAAQESAAILEGALRAGARGLDGPTDSVKAAYQRLRQSCADCHQPYRNAPKSR